MRKIAIIGAGYVGLVTGACFADKNNQVIIVENNQNRIEALLNGQIPFYEPGLDKLVKNAIAKNTITFVNHIQKALPEKPEIIFSCVGTPSLPDGSADLSYVLGVAKEIGQNITDYTLVVNKSTVPVGTGQKVKNIIALELTKRNIKVPFDVASNPEFLKEGDALNDFIYPDRVVVGVESEKAISILENLYRPFLKTQDQFIVTNLSSAELTKYAANAMLATRISFMNEIALLADKVGADVEQVKTGISLDKRIGKHFLNAGIGYGGSCFPKDVKALIHTGKENSQPMTLVEKVDEINQIMRTNFVQNIIHHYHGNITDKKFGIWGLAFKPETDDIRCAPATDIIKQLLNLKSHVYAYDPVAQENMKKNFDSKVTFCSNKLEVLQKVDALIILTEWNEFLQTEPNLFLTLKDRVIFDGRNCFAPASMARLGITYKAVGRNNIIQNIKPLTTNTTHDMTNKQKSHYAAQL